MAEIKTENCYQVIVCGAGHAGCEAALASARMGVRTLLLTGNLDTIAQMSCNPAIGGLAKGHIVREIDALGGEMAVNADATAIQFRVLNASKGPAVQAPRAQCDKKAYQFRMKKVLEGQENLSIFQAEACALIVENGKIRGIETNLGINFYADTVILTTGTFLRGLMHVGLSQTEGGRMGDFCSRKLSDSLEACGIKLERLKTGTPARILGRSINFSKCALQEGDKIPQLFAFYDTRLGKNFENPKNLDGSEIFTQNEQKNEAPRKGEGVKSILGAKNEQIEAFAQNSEISTPKNSPDEQNSQKKDFSLKQDCSTWNNLPKNSDSNFDSDDAKQSDENFSKAKTTLEKSPEAAEKIEVLKTQDSCCVFTNPSTGLPLENQNGKTQSSFLEGKEGPSAQCSEILKKGGSAAFSELKQDNSDSYISQIKDLYGYGNSAGFGEAQMHCYETHTGEATARVIRENLGRSAMYGGAITGIGPRYCPSIEDKIVRFSDKESHRLFLEPEGRDTDEWYINGLSTSMPFDVQIEIIRSIPGLENAEVVRPAYAVEYDFAPPEQIRHTLESRVIAGLFCAGQINGTSGYEEAAGQGLVAGVNAACKILGKAPLVLPRHKSYIGVLIDDLVTKGTKEPYRMFTSRAEYRLLLNHQSADVRLFEYAKNYGLLSKERMLSTAAKIDAINAWVSFIENSAIAAKLRRAPDKILEAGLPESFLNLPKDARDQTLYSIIYKGYLERELRQIKKMQDIENVKLPESINFLKIKGLRIEAAQKLDASKPATMGQASRISGVNPADISVLLVYVKSLKSAQGSDK